MDDNFDLKFQEVKNSIYFLAETVERRYAENNSKIDRLAESIEHLAASGGAVLASGVTSSAASPADMASLKVISNQTLEAAGAVLEFSERSFGELEKTRAGLERISVAVDALAKSPSQPSAQSPEIGVRIEALSKQVTELRVQNKVLIDAVTFLVAEVKAARDQHRA
ncbi:hypothetical protein AUJ65_01600 [Candidatus Micrarchaeota archaeon CG1_02_51_15]|nr:MAG: hypothetical protein AUJ65_01600 [Candidatus Micrarchaeota archaeon CG1_02_51_15]